VGFSVLPDNTGKEVRLDPMYLESNDGMVDDQRVGKYNETRSQGLVDGYMDLGKKYAQTA
jgi:hypothetical protein